MHLLAVLGDWAGSGGAEKGTYQRIALDPATDLRLLAAGRTKAEPPHRCDDTGGRPWA